MPCLIHENPTMGVQLQFVLSCPVLSCPVQRRRPCRPPLPIESQPHPTPFRLTLRRFRHSPASPAPSSAGGYSIDWGASLAPAGVDALRTGAAAGGTRHRNVCHVTGAIASASGHVADLPTHTITEWKTIDASLASGKWVTREGTDIEQQAWLMEPNHPSLQPVLCWRHQ